MKEWYWNELEKEKNLEFWQVKRYVMSKEIDEERATIKSLKNWIRVIKEIKRKLEKLPQDDIRLFFVG